MVGEKDASLDVDRASRARERKGAQLLRITRNHRYEPKNNNQNFLQETHNYGLGSYVCPLLPQ